jgi:hypothetical protein
LEIRARRVAYQEYTADILREGQNAGVIRADMAPEHLAPLILGTMNWTFFWFTPDGPLSATETAQMVRDVIMNGLVAGGGPLKTVPKRKR